MRQRTILMAAAGLAVTLAMAGNAEACHGKKKCGKGKRGQACATVAVASYTCATPVATTAAPAKGHHGKRQGLVGRRGRRVVVIGG